MACSEGACLVVYVLRSATGSATARAHAHGHAAAQAAFSSVLYAKIAQVRVCCQIAHGRTHPPRKQQLLVIHDADSSFKVWSAFKVSRWPLHGSRYSPCLLPPVCHVCRAWRRRQVLRRRRGRHHGGLRAQGDRRLRRTSSAHPPLSAPDSVAAAVQFHAESQLGRLARDRNSKYWYEAA